ncbi:MAG: hypothetical protein KA717_19195 [Woronichinia naegeliana WA131]|jgi:hypothetical protein|uniref:Uncharacterized protein n=1 Tax=Woronichinia naegeliana WA131 TaxID=2824559 RepID=A0A977L2N7_9CYAN|nr:MAG: hypothetical protein KA717_19195 [Woronichinia naegeliana WA131]
MSNDYNDSLEEARRKLVGDNADWIVKFDVEDYVNNPPMIRILYQEKQLLQTECFGLKKDLEEQVVEFNELHSKTVRLSEQLNQVQKDSLPIFTLSVLANLMTGIGINLLTSNSQQWIGGLFIIASVVILIIIYQKTLK